MRVGALPPKPRKRTQGYQGGTCARRVLSVPLQPSRNVEPGPRFHRHFPFIHRDVDGTSHHRGRPGRRHPGLGDGCKLLLALANWLNLRGRDSQGCHSTISGLLTIAKVVPISEAIHTPEPEACAALARP